VLALLVFSLFAFKVGGLDFGGLLKEESRTFVTVMPDIQTLAEGAKVAIAGHRVGRVTHIEYGSSEDVSLVNRRFQEIWGVAPDDVCERYETAQDRPFYPEDKEPRILVYFEVEREAVEAEGGEHAFDLIGPDSFALLLQEGFLGPHYIQLQLGPAGLRQGAADERAHVFGDAFSHGEDEENPIPLLGREAGLFADLLPQLDELGPRLKSLMRKLDEEMLSDENLTSVSGMLSGADNMIKELRAVIGDRIDPLLNAQSPDGVHELILRPTNELLGNADDLVRALKADIQRVLKDHVEALLVDGRGLIANANGAIDTAEASINTITPKVGTVLDNLREGTADLKQRLDHVQGSLTAALTKAEELMQTGADLLSEASPDLLATFSSLRRTMWEAEIAMRKVRANPAVLLWGDDEKLLSPRSIDPSGRRRAGRAPPYQQRDEDDK